MDAVFTHNLSLRRSLMTKLSVLLVFFLLLSVVVMANSIKLATPDDWIDRMMATRGSNPGATVLAGALNPAQPDDWIDRMSAAKSSDIASPGYLWQINQVEVTMNEAGSTKDLDKMLSLFASDATLISGGKTYAGIDQIRAYWTHAGPFLPQNHWAGYTPVYKNHISVRSDRATLQFECLWIDVATRQVQAYSYSNNVLVRVGDKWMIKEMRAGAATET
jgi:uncharacterized protein (TIGR02246 family)